MSGTGQIPKLVLAVEALMLEHFRKEPFHNLRLMLGARSPCGIPGGTCSDKAVSFVSAAGNAGFDASLHSGSIGGREIHRLARIRIGDRLFFADVGNGWPALKLYPADCEVSYPCFGMRFRTEIADGRVAVFHEKRCRESLQLEINVRGRSEEDVRADVEGRFTSGIVYPFSHSLRFSMVVGRRFLFLRGDRLEIYSDSGFESVEGITPRRLPDVLRDYFGYAVEESLMERLSTAGDEPLR